MQSVHNSWFNKHTFRNVYRKHKQSLSHTIMKDGMASAFIPQGTDSTELILIATGFAVSSTDDKEIVSLLDSPLFNEEEEGKPSLPHTGSSERIVIFTNNPVFLPSVSPVVSTSDSAPKLTNLASLELEDEEEWLTGLQSFISDVTSSGAVPQGTPSSGPSLSVVTDAAVGEVRREKNRRFQIQCLAARLFYSYTFSYLSATYFIIYLSWRS